MTAIHPGQNREARIQRATPAAYSREPTRSSADQHPTAIATQHKPKSMPAKTTGCRPKGAPPPARHLVAKNSAPTTPSPPRPPPDSPTPQPSRFPPAPQKSQSPPTRPSTKRRHAAKPEAPARKSAGTAFVAWKSCPPAHAIYSCDVPREVFARRKPAAPPRLCVFRIELPLPHTSYPAPHMRETAPASISTAQVTA